MATHTFVRPSVTSCGHTSHVGTCSSCQQIALARAKHHVMLSIKARQRWEAKQNA